MHTQLSEDRRVEVDTPEHVVLGFELAGAGSRILAFFMDVAIMIGAVVAVLFAFLLLAVAGVPRPAVPVTVAILLLVMFVIFWGYFALFEGLRDGQTPGKRRFSLRVVHAGGYPLTMRGAVIRNLVRLIDAQPLPSFVLGGAMIMLHGRAQRLGDLAADTLVVRERKLRSFPEEATATGSPQLSDAHYDVLREYALRRDGLELAARERIAAQLAPHFASYPLDAARGRVINPANPKHADILLTSVYADESGRRTTAGVSTGSGSAAAALLVRRQQASWREYGALLDRARARSLAALPESDLSRFAGLYREVSADLARARTYRASPEMLYTLERTVAGGHNVLYRKAPRTLRSALAWITSRFPALLRRRWREFALASLLFYGPAVPAFLVIARDPAVARTMVPAEMIVRAEEGAARQAAGTGYVEVPELMMPLMSSQIITNNVQVAFIAFAGGIAAGIGTALVLLFNGIFLGAVAGLFHAEGLDLYLWSFVLPHGVIELTAIGVAGAAGLLMGSAIVLPGRHSRRYALTQRSREAVSLLGGAAVMLLVAGVIEGFISPSTLPAAVKLSFGAGTGVLLAAYLLLAGRGTSAEGQPAAAHETTAGPGA